MGLTVPGSKMFPSHAVAQHIDLYAFTGFRVNTRPVGPQRLNGNNSSSTAINRRYQVGDSRLQRLPLLQRLSHFCKYHLHFFNTSPRRSRRR